jgi:hypothetical protein
VSIEQALYEYLLAHAPLTAKIGANKVFFVLAPQGTEFDYVVINKIAGNRLTKVSFGSPLFQVSYFSRSEFRAVDGADVLVAALDGYKGTWGTMQVVGSYQDDRVLAEDGSIFHAPVDVRINYLEV